MKSENQLGWGWGDERAAHLTPSSASAHAPTPHPCIHTHTRKRETTTPASTEPIVLQSVECEMHKPSTLFFLARLLLYRCPPHPNASDGASKLPETLASTTGVLGLQLHTTVWVLGNWTQVSWLMWRSLNPLSQTLNESSVVESHP